jgi:hypothetical protein
MGAGDDDGHADTSEERSNERGVHGLAQFGAPDLGQIGQGNADNQRGLNPFPKRNNESLKHLRSAFDFENEFQFQLQG